MNANAAYTIQTHLEGVWSIEMAMVRAFLVAGETSALLIDTGAGGVDLRAAVHACTHLPVRVVNTHAHYDHISGNASFDMIFAHPRELAALAQAGYRVQPVSDGNGFDLGGVMLQVLSLPGHSPGSIGLWDAARGLLFAGDTVARGRSVFLSQDGASVEAYLRTLGRILALAHDEEGGTLSRIFCAHGEAECSLDTVRALQALVVAYQAGRSKREPLPEAYVADMQPGIAMVRQGDVSLLVP